MFHTVRSVSYVDSRTGNAAAAYGFNAALKNVSNLSFDDIKPLKESEIIPDYKLPVEEVFNSRGQSRKYNYGTRNGETVDTIILHATVGSFQSTISTFLKKGNTSAHFVVDLDGKVYSVVDMRLAAHHAGIPKDKNGIPIPGKVGNEWDGKGKGTGTGLNNNSVGIEIVNPGVPVPEGENKATWDVTNGDNYKDQPAFTPAQIESVKRLTAYIMGKYPSIAPYDVIAHSDAKPEGKADPGYPFPWKSFADDGLGLWVKPAPLTEKGDTLQYNAAAKPNDELIKWQELLRRGGYTMLDANGIYDIKMLKVVKAFQLHYRPEKIDGVLDPSTQKTLLAYVEARDKAKADWEKKKNSKPVPSPTIS